MTVDCMTCLVTLARGVAKSGTYVDKRGITHATTYSQHLCFRTCTVDPDPDHPGQILTHRSRWRTTSDDD